ncbi:hypothetical protein Tco_0890172 [Tanacetum coccineum]
MGSRQRTYGRHIDDQARTFVTTAKQARNLHSVTFDQLYAFLKHNERDAKEVREMRQRFLEPLALLANTYNPHPSYSSNQTQYQAQPSEVYQPYQYYQSSTPIIQQLIQSPPLQSYAPTVVQQPPTFQPDTGLAIPTFLSTNDPIASLNKAMIFLSLVYRSKFLPTNNQLRTSSNPRTQATIQNGQVTVQNVQGRQSQGYARNAGNNQASGAQVINEVGNTRVNQPRVIKCYNYKCEGHMAKQCAAKKRVKDSEWFKDKMLLAQAQETGVLQATTNFKTYHVDVYDLDYDDEATTNAIFMVNLSPVGSLNDDTVAPRYDSNTLFESYDELKGNNDVISYTDYMLTIRDDDDNYVPPPVQKNDMMLSVIEQMKSQVEKCNKVNQESKSEIESLTSELER